MRKRIDLDALLQVLREHDEYRMELVIAGVKHRIGVRSDYEYRAQGLYFAKHYYIDEQDYLSPIEFTRALSKLVTEQMSVSYPK